MEYTHLAFNIRLWKWSERDISRLWKRYKAVVVINPRAGYAVCLLNLHCNHADAATAQAYQQQVLNL